MSYPDRFGRSPIDTTIYNEKYHYIFALLNHGFKFTDGDLSFGYCNDDTIKTAVESFIKSERYRNVINSQKPIGMKLLDIDGSIGICPITQEKIILRPMHLR